MFRARWWVWWLAIAAPAVLVLYVARTLDFFEDEDWTEWTTISFILLVWTTAALGGIALGVTAWQRSHRGEATVGC